MDRRSWIRTSTAAVLGLGAAGCAPRVRAGEEAVAGVLPRRSFPLIRAGWDRVIRTTVGLRPHRPSGFRVEAERFDETLVVHNYGHGGAGHSLSWGTSQMAAELALRQEDRTAAVLGCGIAGLTATRQLQRRGFDVTVYAASVPPDTTSNMALAAFTPESGLFDRDRLGRDWDARYARASSLSYRQLQLLAGRDYGISWVDTFRWSEQPPRPSIGPELPTGAVGELDVGEVVLPPGQHPFPGGYAIYRPTLRIEPSVYLDRLVDEVQTAGARIVVRRFDALEEVLALDERVVVNCSGLGSRDLFGDAELIPVKGQLTFLVPQPEIDYRLEGRAPGGGRIGLMPRRDGIAIGHTNERGEWSLEPDPEVVREMVGRAIALTDAMARTGVT